ncbi:uncharacterized protein LOC124122859 [Haliotis rufescens]|uniref:uncharacterized protein LOC124122859 n=1 Tax=Haliotis rufescens TaxID=6454 RepID=UPI00201ECF77|nr:uncharacterized protein LOC124122859 [Haliotis rufescens]
MASRNDTGGSAVSGEDLDHAHYPDGGSDHEAVEVEDVGSEASKSGGAWTVASGTGSPDELMLLESDCAPPSREDSVWSGGSRRGRSGGGSRVSYDSSDNQEGLGFRSRDDGACSYANNRTGNLSSRQSTSSELRLQMDRMQKADEERKMAARKKRDEEVALLRRKMEEVRRRKGIELVPGSRDSRGVIRAFLTEEEKMAMESQQKDLARESVEMISQIKSKHGIPKDKESSPDVVVMATEFYSSKEMPNELLPDHIRLNLTTEEIRDLKLVFDMFDVKGRGYIISYDLRRAAGMLGFTAKKHVFKEMIDELSTDQKGKVTFINFLEFIIKSQGEGPDPYEEIIQCFHLLDVSGKGFLTFSDLREAADHTQVRLSNRAVREMLQEADVTGDGKITPDEFVHIMLQTNTFRLTNKGRTRLK